MMLKYFYFNITLDHSTPFIFHSCPFLCSNPALLMALPPFSNTNTTTNSRTWQGTCYHWKLRCPSLPPSPPSTLISIPCTPSAKQGSCSLGWCSLGSQPDPHHIPTLCQDALLGGKEKASPAGCRRGKQLRGGFLSSSSRDLWNALNWFSKYSVSHWSSKHIYMLPALCTLNFIGDKKF